MSDFTVFLDDIRSWIVHKEYTDPVVTSFVRMAETTLSQSLRVRQMMLTETLPVTDGQADLPDAFVEAEMLRVGTNKPLEFKTVEDFFSNEGRKNNWYTILANKIVLGWEYSVDETPSVEMTYYTFVPTFTSATNWLHQKYYNIFLQSSIAAAALYAQEWERASSIEALASGLVDAANNTHKTGKVSGSILKVSRGRVIGSR